MEKQKGAGIKTGSFSLRDSQGPGLLPGGEKGGTDQGKQEERAGKNRRNGPGKTGKKSGRPAPDFVRRRNGACRQETVREKHRLIHNMKKGVRC
jgi:hypothetical protein